MIVRVLVADVTVRKSAELHELMRRQLPILRGYDGLVYVKLARRLEGDLEQVILIEEWRDAEAMYAWTGPDLTIPRLLPGSSDLISKLTITHYEALDIDVPEAAIPASLPGVILGPRADATGP
jgi:hypothetical protein